MFLPPPLNCHLRGATLVTLQYLLILFVSSSPLISLQPFLTYHFRQYLTWKSEYDNFKLACLIIQKQKFDIRAKNIITLRIIFTLSEALKIGYHSTKLNKQNKSYQKPKMEKVWQPGNLVARKFLENQALAEFFLDSSPTFSPDLEKVVKRPQAEYSEFYNVLKIVGFASKCSQAPLAPLAHCSFFQVCQEIIIFKQRWNPQSDVAY